MAEFGPFLVIGYCICIADIVDNILNHKGFFLSVFQKEKLRRLTNRWKLVGGL